MKTRIPSINTKINRIACAMHDEYIGLLESHYEKTQAEGLAAANKWHGPFPFLSEMLNDNNRQLTYAEIMREGRYALLNKDRLRVVEQGARSRIRQTLIKRPELNEHLKFCR